MPRRESKLEVNMFPFLSVLCSVIGVLMLFMLSVLGTRVLDALEPVTNPYASPSPQGAQPVLSDRDKEAIQREIANLANQLAARQQELREMQQLRAQLQVMLELKRDEMEFAAGEGLVMGTNIGPKRDVVMQPDDADALITKIPRYVEVALDQYKISWEGKAFPVSDLPPTDKGVDPSYRPMSAFELFLNEFYAKRDREYLVFLVRPSGAAAFDRVRTYLGRKYPGAPVSEIDVGWEPFSQDWILQNAGGN